MSKREQVVVSLSPTDRRLLQKLVAHLGRAFPEPEGVLYPKSERVRAGLVDNGYVIPKTMSSRGLWVGDEALTETSPKSMNQLPSEDGGEDA